MLTITYLFFHIAVKRNDWRRQAAYLVIDVLVVIYALWVVSQ